jgi:hypothetical protein
MTNDRLNQRAIQAFQSGIPILWHQNVLFDNN